MLLQQLLLFLRLLLLLLRLLLKLPLLLEQVLLHRLLVRVVCQHANGSSISSAHASQAHADAPCLAM